MVRHVSVEPKEDRLGLGLVEVRGLLYKDGESLGMLHGVYGGSQVTQKDRCWSSQSGYSGLGKPFTEAPKSVGSVSVSPSQTLARTIILGLGLDPRYGP